MDSFFEVERHRSVLAREKAYTELLATYTKSYPYLSDKNSAKLWNKLNNEHITSYSISPMEMDKLQTVAKFININNKKILNIGFGSANLEAIIDQKSGIKRFAWEGIDIAHKSVKIAQKRYPTAKFYTGDIRTVKIKKNEYDLIIALEVLEHIEPFEILPVIRKIFYSLKLGGKFIVSVPVNEGLEEMVNKGINPNAHVRDYSPELIEAELVLAGFDVRNSYIFYAFNKQYLLKKIISSAIPHLKNPNGVLIIAEQQK